MGNTAIACHNGRVLALNEAGYPIEVKVDSQGQVSTGAVVRFDGKLAHPFTAHPKIDPDTNEMCSFGYKCAPLSGPLQCTRGSHSQAFVLQCRNRVQSPWFQLQSERSARAAITQGWVQRHRASPQVQPANI